MITAIETQAIYAKFDIDLSPAEIIELLLTQMNGKLKTHATSPPMNGSCVGHNLTLLRMVGIHLFLSVLNTIFHKINNRGFGPFNSEGNQNVCNPI